MTIGEKINQIEKLLETYKSTSYTEEELNDLQANIQEIKEQMEADLSKTDTEIINESANDDEAAERILAKYGVGNTGTNNVYKDHYTGDVEADSDAMLERFTAKSHVDKTERAESKIYKIDERKARRY